MPERTSTPAATKPCDQVVVILGASNVTLAWPRIISLLAERFHGVTHVYCAHGMGRSYLFKRSSFAARQLPGILHCELWNDLPAIDPSIPTYAIVTDLGNDLLYGSDSDRVAESAMECTERLRSWSPGTQIVVSLPPVDSVERIGRLRFQVASRILFPMTQLKLADTKSKTRDLADRLAELAHQENVATFQPQSQWYGMDPIHVRRRFQREAFAGMMALWNGPSADSKDSASTAPPSPTRVPRMLKKRPKARIRWVWRREIKTPQPVATAEKLIVFCY